MKHFGGGIDFILHSIGMSLNVRKGKSYTEIDYNFNQKTLDISAMSLHRVLRSAWDMDALNEHASVIALTYIAAQRVLGELYRVQRLVNQISAKIKEQTATDAQGNTSGPSTPSGERRESEVSLPFSTVMLSQLEADMRKRLKSLSLGMAAHLRRD